MSKITRMQYDKCNNPGQRKVPRKERDKQLGMLEEAYKLTFKLDFLYRTPEEKRRRALGCMRKAQECEKAR